MDEIVVCSRCHTTVRPTDYFCFNCGANLRPVPPSLSVEKQAMLYLGSFFLPPMGIIWGLPYIRQPDRTSKIVGYIAVGLTVIALILAVQVTVNIMNGVNKQMNEIQNLQGF
jgi:hypothetical protein